MANLVVSNFIFTDIRVLQGWREMGDANAGQVLQTPVSGVPELWAMLLLAEKGKKTWEPSHIPQQTLETKNDEVPGDT